MYNGHPTCVNGIKECRVEYHWGLVKGQAKHKIIGTLPKSNK
jgi:hypothetical protein